MRGLQTEDSAAREKQVGEIASAAGLFFTSGRGRACRVQRGWLLGRQLPGEPPAFLLARHELARFGEGEACWA